MTDKISYKSPSIEAEGVSRWLARRNISIEKFKAWVGDDPEHPLVSKRKLGRLIDTKSNDTVNRLLTQFKREQEA